MAMDLKRASTVKQREDEGTTVHIKDESGELAYYRPLVVPTGMDPGDQPVTVKIAGTYSALYRKTAEAQTRRMFKKRQPQMSPELWQEHRIELVATCVMDWQGFTNDGVPMDCTRENVSKFLEAAPWILAQLEEAQADHAGFFRTNSAS